MTRRKTRDFADANAQPFLLEGGERGVLLLHGFTGSPAHMRPIGEELHKRGYTVLGIALPGHGARMEDMLSFGWRDWLQAAREGFLSLRERLEWVAVAGLSMGGLLALLIAQEAKPDAVVTLSTPMALTNRLASLGPVVSLFQPMTYWKGDDLRERLLDQEYDYGYPGFPTASLHDLTHLIRLARRNLFAVTCPVLAVQSKADTTVRPDSADIILKGVSSKKKALLLLEEVPHVLTISRECGHIAAAMENFFKEAYAAHPREEISKPAPANSSRGIDS